jgi:glycerophosphoryl diester phosphodiesterase
LSSCEMFKNFTKTVIFAHRGACALAPENTISSFELAVTHEADAIELDTKLSSDGVAMVIHDPTLDRTTNGTGKVNEHTLAELKALDAGSKFNPKFAGEKLPTLEDVFEAVGKKVLVNVELTNYSSPNDDLIAKVADVVKRQNMQDRVLFSSFLPKNLKMMKVLLPDTPVALLCLEGLGGFFSRSIFLKNVSPSIIHPYLADVNPDYVQMEHRRNRRVHVWTVNADQDIKKMMSMRVDGIFTDDPQKARKIMVNL